MKSWLAARWLLLTWRLRQWFGNLELGLVRRFPSRWRVYSLGMMTVPAMQAHPSTSCLDLTVGQVMESWK